MRKLTIFIVIISFLTSYGCKSKTYPNTNIISNNTTEYREEFFLQETPSTFVNYLYSNPIDISMGEELEKLYSTKDIDEVYSKYYIIWTEEMDLIYEELINKLPEDSKIILKLSQEEWAKENQYDSDLWNHIFDVSKGRGSGDYSMILNQSINRIRLRTFLLAEYLYWLTGDYFEFSYK